MLLSLRGSTMKNTSTPKILRIYQKKKKGHDSSTESFNQKRRKETKKVGDWKGNGEIEGECADEKESDEGKKKKAVRINDAVKWMVPSQRARATVVWIAEYSVPRKTVGSVTPSWRSPLVSFSSPTRSILEQVKIEASLLFLSISPSLSVYVYTKCWWGSGLFEGVSKRAVHTWRHMKTREWRHGTWYRFFFSF